MVHIQIVPQFQGSVNGVGIKAPNGWYVMYYYFIFVLLSFVYVYFVVLFIIFGLFIYFDVV